jgi:outer membrane receptor protein involved in Fe transport
LFDLSSDFVSRFDTSDSRTRRVDLRLQEDMAFTPVVGASAGVEFQRERGSSTFVTGPEFTEIPIYRSVAGTFAEFRYASRERLFVTAGLRLEHLTRDALEPDAFSTRPPFPEQSIDSLNPKLAVSYRINGARVHASAGTGIRPPNVFEIAFTDNPNLKPERSRSFEAGVDQTLAGGALALRATAFFNRYDDLLVTIERSLRDASRYKTDNVSNARARGLELAADARPLRALTARATYTLLGTEILSVDGLVGTAPPPFKVGDPLLRRPRHQGALDLVYAHRRVTAFVDLTTRSRTLDVEPSFGSSRGLFFSSGYAVANAGMSVRVAPAVDVYGRVLNVTDRAYEEALGFPALRRSALIGVRIAASR